jgi:lipid II:glycine glycyltransferase (peptidoglycan interpeptide bridge formation enzyme)
LKCHHIEINDRYICEDDCKDLSFFVKYTNGYEIDLTKSEDELFANMESSCRRCIRKAQKCGVVIEEASDVNFASDYYEQHKDVADRHSLVPTYGIDRVQSLIKYIQPTGHLLLLRAKNSEGLCIATGIFPAFNGTMYFWGGASLREHQILRPNEVLIWYAMRYWKARGIKKFDMGGGGDYKKKYGGCGVRVPRLIKSRYGFLTVLRNLAHRVFKIRLEMSARLMKRKRE